MLPPRVRCGFDAVCLSVSISCSSESSGEARCREGQRLRDARRIPEEVVGAFRPEELRREDRPRTPALSCPPYLLTRLVGWLLAEGAEDQPFAFFWITDSCPHTVDAIANRAPFEVLSLAGSIAVALQI